MTDSADQSISDVLTLGDRITVLPVIHGSGDFAIEVRRLMMAHHFDCVAVPLPPSFSPTVLRGVELLPSVSIALQRETGFRSAEDYDPETPSDEEAPPPGRVSYVPIDPCQPVIAALRIAVQERMATAFVDIEDDHWEPATAVFPDPYALKRVSPDRFAAAVLPGLPGPQDEGELRRIHWMANQLHDLRQQHEKILFVCGLTDWPWIRDAYNRVVDCPPPGPEAETELCGVSESTLTFVLGELPFVTGLYELARAQLANDENLSVDGVKALLLCARDQYRAELGTRARRITPQILKSCLKYIRNLSLFDRRFTPDLYSIATAARQTVGDQYAVHVAETARAYPFERNPMLPMVRCAVERMMLPTGEIADYVSRLPGPPLTWRRLELKTRPDRETRVRWESSWNPFGQCSWPPEDVAIERFRTHVRDVALQLLGNDLARTEKFSSSLKDGLDIRETLRNWHTGELYVKVQPPSRGRVDCVVMLFDSPADPRDYPWRITWHAEHQDESTLSLFATNFLENMVGPGIANARYGGCMFLFPPRPVPDIWQDPRFDFADTLEERLLAAGLQYSNESHVVLLSALPPGAGWRSLARRYRKRILHVPLSRFGSETIDRLRMFHVLNGQQIRSYAARFIRDP